MIIDANAIQHLKNRTDAGRPVLHWLLSPSTKAGLIVGGKLLDEIMKTTLLETLGELKRANRLFVVERAKVERLTVELTRVCKSNDAHVVALVRLTKCNLVFTGDNLLHADLKRREITGAKVSVYQSASHMHLLRSCNCVH